jgi:hypothetical protein
MIDRQKVESILSCRFPGAPREQLAAAANALMGLPEEWEELSEHEWVCTLSVPADVAYDLRVFRRRKH